MLLKSSDVRNPTTAIVFHMTEISSSEGAAREMIYSSLSQLLFFQSPFTRPRCGANGDASDDGHADDALHPEQNDHRDQKRPRGHKLANQKQGHGTLKIYAYVCTSKSIRIHPS
jgi:hypothetical protein